MTSRAVLAAFAAFATLAALVPACAGPTSRAEEEQRLERTRQSAAALDHTETFEIRFGSELVGYLIDVLPVPEGQPDERAYEPGTALIEALDGECLGFISPGGTTYRFDTAGKAKIVGFGARTSGIAAFFRRNDPPTLTPAES